MSLKNYKIMLDEESVKGKLISNLPNRPTMNPAELKSYFDYLPTTVLGLTKLNGLIEFLSVDGAADIGVSVSGITATKIQAVIEELLSAIISVKGENWQGENAKKNAEDILLVKGEGWQSENLKELATEIDVIKGEGWTTQTLKGLADVLDEIKGENWQGESLRTNTENLTIHKSSADHDERYPLKNTLGKIHGIATLGEDGKLFEYVDASKISSGVLPLSVLPDAVKIKNVSVEDWAKALQLTTADIQNGDFIVVENEISWYQVVDDTKLGTNSAFRKVPTGVVGQAIMSQQYDANYTGGNSIAVALIEKDGKINDLSGVGRTTETVKSNADNVASLGGIGRTTETVKGNADAIASLQTEKADKSSLSTKVSELVNDSDFDTVPSVNQKIANSGGAIISSAEPPGKENSIWINPTTGVIKYWSGTAWASTYGVFA